jgi:CSLREA domain-containing protein
LGQRRKPRSEPAHAVGSKQGLAAIALLLALAFAGPVFAANLIVDTLNDADDGTDGVCSLREAIIAANNDADHNGCVGTGGYGADTIIFSDDGTILLNSTLPSITDGTGLTIDGTEHSITVSGQDNVRVMFVAAGAVVELVGLTVADGNGVSHKGGGVENNGTLIVRNSTFSGNRASVDGESKPDDFASGDAAMELAQRIQDEMDTLSCNGG